jgi:DNA-binding phage protein
VETDVVTKEPVKRLVSNVVKKKSLLQQLMRVTAKEFGGSIPKDELRKVENLAIFLERATALEPASRLTPEEAMQTKFIMSVKQSIASSQGTTKVAAKKGQK